MSKVVTEPHSPDPLSLTEQLIASAALAATSVRSQSSQGPKETPASPSIPEAISLVEQALRAGAWAARQGVCLPAYCLLDLHVLLPPGEHPVPIPGRDRQQTAITWPYDRWLEEFCSAAPEKLRRLSFRQGATPTSRDYLSLLIAAWPGRQPAGPWAGPWERAYQELARVPNRVLQAWEATRTLDRQAWEEWWPGPVAPPSLSLPPALWARFTSARPGLPLPEKFDHEAAHLYLTAEDVGLLPHQVVKIHRLQSLRAEEGRVQTDSYEEQTLYEGAHSLSTLTLGEIGDHKFAQGTDPRQGAPPRAQVPPTLRVHLCWLLGYSALLETVPAPWLGYPLEGEAPPPRQPAPQVNQSSFFQALMALLLDDWRMALSGLRVRFHVHRISPEQSSAEAGRPGGRFKALAREPAGGLPSAELIALLFERLDHAQLALAQLAWKKVPGQRPGFVSSMGTQASPTPPGWWCGCVRVEDLPDLGFHGPPGAARDHGHRPPTWKATGGGLPREVSHLLVVDLPGQTGWIYRVVRVEGECQLRPLPLRHQRATGQVPFAALRHAAIDTLLDVLLEARFRR
jgi:hypothetical protein